MEAVNAGSRNKLSDPRGHSGDLYQGTLKCKKPSASHLHTVGQRRRLGKVVQVPQGESEHDRLLEVDGDVVLLLICRAGLPAQRHREGNDVKKMASGRRLAIPVIIPKRDICCANVS